MTHPRIAPAVPVRVPGQPRAHPRARRRRRPHLGVHPSPRGEPDRPGRGWVWRVHRRVESGELIAPPITRKFRPEAPKNGLSNRSVGEKRESVQFRCRPVSKTSRFGRLESRFSTIHRANGAVSFFFTIENQTRARREARSVSVYRGSGFDLRYGSFSAAAAIIRTRDYSVPTSAFFYT